MKYGFNKDKMTRRSIIKLHPDSTFILCEYSSKGENRHKEIESNSPNRVLSGYWIKRGNEIHTYNSREFLKSDILNIYKIYNNRIKCKCRKTAHNNKHNQPPPKSAFKGIYCKPLKIFRLIKE